MQSQTLARQRGALVAFALSGALALALLHWFPPAAAPFVLIVLQLFWGCALLVANPRPKGFDPLVTTRGVYSAAAQLESTWLSRLLLIAFWTLAAILVFRSL